MTRKHFQHLAETLGMAIAVESLEDTATAKGLCVGAAWRVADAVADALYETNPNYDLARFIDAIRKQEAATLARLQADTARAGA
jgi:hypothetical protein